MARKMEAALQLRAVTMVAQTMAQPWLRENMADGQWVIGMSKEGAAWDRGETMGSLGMPWRWHPWGKKRAAAVASGSEGGDGILERKKGGGLGWSVSRGRERERKAAGFGRRAGWRWRPWRKRRRQPVASGGGDGSQTDGGGLEVATDGAAIGQWLRTTKRGEGRSSGLFDRWFRAAQGGARVVEPKRRRGGPAASDGDGPTMGKRRGGGGHGSMGEGKEQRHLGSGEEAATGQAAMVAWRWKPWSTSDDGGVARQLWRRGDGGRSFGW